MSDAGCIGPAIVIAAMAVVIFESITPALGKVAEALHDVAKAIRENRR